MLFFAAPCDAYPAFTECTAPGHDVCSVHFWLNAQVLSRVELLHSKQSPDYPTDCCCYVHLKLLSAHPPACLCCLQCLLQVEDLLRGDEPDAITFERIHGRSSNIIQAKDLDLHTFAPRDFPPQGRANGVAGQIDLPAEPERVLLTGANGFLGRFLLLDFLQRVSTK